MKVTVIMLCAFGVVVAGMLVAHSEQRDAKAKESYPEQEYIGHTKIWCSPEGVLYQVGYGYLTLRVDQLGTPVRCKL